MNEKLAARLAPVKFAETDFVGQGREGISQLRLRLPLKSNESAEDYAELRAYCIAMMLGFHIRSSLLRSPSMPIFGYTGFVEYALYPKARFSTSGEVINAFGSINDIQDREKSGDYSLLREEYKSAPLEAKIYVRPDSVVCEYQYTDEQGKDDSGVMRDEVKIIAKVTVPDKSVHVDFILRNFSILHAS